MGAAFRKPPDAPGLLASGRRFDLPLPLPCSHLHDLAKRRPARLVAKRGTAGVGLLPHAMRKPAMQGGLRWEVVQLGTGGHAGSRPGRLSGVTPGGLLAEAWKALHRHACPTIPLNPRPRLNAGPSGSAMWRLAAARWRTKRAGTATNALPVKVTPAGIAAIAGNGLRVPAMQTRRRPVRDRWRLSGRAQCARPGSGPSSPPYIDGCSRTSGISQPASNGQARAGTRPNHGGGSGSPMPTSSSGVAKAGPSRHAFRGRIGD
jgi:hypothetical protein